MRQRLKERESMKKTKIDRKLHEAEVRILT